MYSLGCRVGTCCASLSSFSMCSSVVLPALSNPRNNSLPDFFHNPVITYIIYKWLCFYHYRYQNLKKYKICSETSANIYSLQICVTVVRLDWKDKKKYVKKKFHVQPPAGVNLLNKNVAVNNIQVIILIIQ